MGDPVAWAALNPQVGAGACTKPLTEAAVPRDARYLKIEMSYRAISNFGEHERMYAAHRQ